MRTNIVLDDRGKQRDVLALIGEEVIASDYDVRAVRGQMTRDPG
jgi:hypothetical protein